MGFEMTGNRGEGKFPGKTPRPKSYLDLLGESGGYPLAEVTSGSM